MVMHQPRPLPDEVGVGGGDGEIIHRLEAGFGFNFFEGAGGAVRLLDIVADLGTAFVSITVSRNK